MSFTQYDFDALPPQQRAAFRLRAVIELTRRRLRQFETTPTAELAREIRRLQEQGLRLMIEAASLRLPDRVEAALLEAELNTGEEAQILRFLLDQLTVMAEAELRGTGDDPPRDEDPGAR